MLKARPGGGRPRARGRVRRRRRPVRLARGRAGGLRPRHPGDAAPGRRAHPRPRRRAASSSWGRAGCATSSSPCRCSSWCTAGSTSRCACGPRCRRSRLLVEGGYVGREDGKTLALAYRFLRVLEHRIQLFRLRRTHVLPEAEEDLRRIGRSLGYPEPVTELLSTWRHVAAGVRRLHERLYYSPLLEAVARIPTSELRLTTRSAEDRLQALGYDDPAAALRHIAALSQGVTRQAGIQRQLLPAMLGWFAEAPNPDAGLFAFRQVSEALGSTPWYLRALRDEGAMAERLARILASSRYAVSLLTRAPQTVQMLAQESRLRPRPLAEIRSEMLAAARRQSGSAAARGGGAGDPAARAVPGRRGRPARRDRRARGRRGADRRHVGDDRRRAGGRPCRLRRPAGPADRRGRDGSLGRARAVVRLGRRRDVRDGGPARRRAAGGRPDPGRRPR